MEALDLAAVAIGADKSAQAARSASSRHVRQLSTRAIVTAIATVAVHSARDV